MAARKYHFDERANNLIINAYRSDSYGRKTGPSAIHMVANRLGVTRSAVYTQALRLGLVKPGTIEGGRAWTAEENAILERNAHMSPHSIARIMRRNGFDRTPAAICIRIKRTLEGRNEARLDKGVTKLAEAARLLGCAPTFLRELIERGELKAAADEAEQPRPDGRVAAWLIKEADLREVIIQYTAHLNFGKIDKFWLVDVLTNSGREKGGKNER